MGKPKGSKKKKRAAKQPEAPDEFGLDGVRQTSKKGPRRHPRAIAAKYQQMLVAKVSRSAFQYKPLSLDPLPRDLTGLVELKGVFVYNKHLNGTHCANADAQPIPLCSRGTEPKNSCPPCRGATLAGFNAPFPVAATLAQLVHYEKTGEGTSAATLCLPCQQSDLTQRYFQDPDCTFDYTPTYHMPFNSADGFVESRCMNIKGVNILAWHDADYDVITETHAGKTRKLVRFDRIIATAKAAYATVRAPESKTKQSKLQKKFFCWRAATLAQ